MKRPASALQTSLVVATALILLPSVLVAQDLRYDVSFANRVHHEAYIEVTFAGLGSEPLELRMSRASPGRYRLHEFAKNVYGESARDGAGRSLTLETPDAHGWRVSGHDGTVVFAYTLYADLLSGTYSAIDIYQAALNGPASWVWAKGLEDRAVVVTFDLPEGWEVASQLFPTDDAAVWRAPDLGYLLDSPVGLGPFLWKEWSVPLSPGADEEVTIRYALQWVADGIDDADVRRELEVNAERARKIVAEQAGVFGELPTFETGTYTFIAKYVPWAGSDAMEHRNSTILVSPRDLVSQGLVLQETLAHEFFHVWNVERIRPKDLEPFDFEDAAFTDALWFAEGFTNYYDSLSMVRAGLITQESYLSDVLTPNLEDVRSTPARELRGPARMSQLAAFNDRGYWRDPTNRENTFFHYYNYGEALALALDLELRAHHESSVDALFRGLWQRFGKQEVPYTLVDLEREMARHVGETRAREWFRDFIEGSELPPYEDLLATVGLRWPRASDELWVGEPIFGEHPDGVEISSPTRRGTPLYEAGLDRGDVIYWTEPVPVESGDDLLRALAARDGDFEIEFWQRGKVVKSTLRPVPDPRREVRRAEDLGETAGSAALERRRAWLASKADGFLGEAR